MALPPAMSYICKNKTVHFFRRDEKQDKVQDYELIREEMLKAKAKFEDDQFPPGDRSLYMVNEDGNKIDPHVGEDHLYWKRPLEFTNGQAKFIDHGMSRFDIIQGHLGNCWILAAMANLPTRKDLWNFVVPQDQSFDAGVFHFRFWRQGRWIDVVVDDRLPTHMGKLNFVRSSNSNEFWSALLEKAYAKMFGSYEALAGGETIESMVDFSGGIPEVYHLKNRDPNELFKTLCKDCKQNAWLTCSTDDSTDEANQQKQAKYGINVGHAFTLLDITEVKFDDKEQNQKLVRIRNPWGNELEWKGSYSDNSIEWTKMSDLDWKTRNLRRKEDGEFWMLFDDFMEQFDNVELCHLSSNIFKPGEFDSKRYLTVHHGLWSIEAGTAGGNIQYKESFNKNPWYKIIFEECHCDVDSDKEKDADVSRHGCSMIVSLMQKDRRTDKKDDLKTLTIGFYVYLVPDDLADDKIPNYIDSQNPLFSTNFKGIYREVSAYLVLKTGTYLIVPSTDKPNLDAKFMIRILTEKQVKHAELF